MAIFQKSYKANISDAEVEALTTDARGYHKGGLKVLDSYDKDEVR